MKCPDCYQKLKVTHKRGDKRYLFCEPCGKRYKSMEVFISDEEKPDIREIFEEYGFYIREETVNKLKDTDINIIKDYLSNKELIITEFEKATHSLVRDSAGFLINAILCRHPIPRPRNGNGRSPEDRWDNILKELSNIMNPAALHGVSVVGLIDDKLLIVRATDNKDWLEQQTLKPINRVASYTENVEVAFI